MNRSILIAAVVVIAIIAWMLSGQLQPRESEAPTVSRSAATEVVAMKVQTRRQSASEMTREIIIQGQVEPVKIAHIRAQTNGTVAKKLASKGQIAAADEPIIELAIESRDASLAVARAGEIQATNEYEAARKLQKQGLQSRFSLESATARLEAAKAQVIAAQLEIENTRIDANFAGLVEDITVEVGDFVERGQTVATLVDQRQLLITGRIPQQNISDVRVGQRANAELITGDTVEGVVQYVASMADSATRSFRVEVLVESPPERVMTGVSAEIRIPSEQLRAHLISPAILALNDAGELGVKAVDEENRVEFYLVEVVKTESQGAWVTGIPEQANLITLGQGFVNPGEVVQPVAEPES